VTGQANDTTTLYRPVGPRELELIGASGFKRFPPRLPEQPIFYPVLSRSYAEQIARDWNSLREDSCFIGYVTRFEVETTLLSRYVPRQLGAAEHREYWVPSEELEEFNRHIVGLIEVIAEFRHGRLMESGSKQGESV
jgi:hypothetical protein